MFSYKITALNFKGEPIASFYDDSFNTCQDAEDAADEQAKQLHNESDYSEFEIELFETKQYHYYTLKLDWVKS
jgi:hypothetical protein